LVREVEDATRSATYRSALPLHGSSIEGDLGAAFDLRWLRSAQRPPHGAVRGVITVVDLFSGCGGLTLGAWEACRALGLDLKVALAADMDQFALDVLRRNFAVGATLTDPLETVIDGELGAPPTSTEQELAELGPVDLLVAGPPCQGHSDLNNHTRRRDPRNALYLRAARFVELYRPPHVIIENVPGVVHDAGKVVQATMSLLRRLGYAVEGVAVRAEQFGVPQRRRRFFTIASSERQPRTDLLLRRYSTAPRSFLWACGDLIDLDESETPYDSSAVHSSENKRRIDYLFTHDLYELPDAQRPNCHRDKRHSYKSVYGRIRPNEPVQTITAGFGSTGQGRFVHPFRRRTVTPHEAARLQFFPDFFSFGDSRRAVLQRLIGNAVPPKLGHMFALELLR
jgi:DNA (cytosine-5)-methyltransferase 1